MEFLAVTPITWLAAALPIITIALGLLGLKWSAPRVGAASWFVAIAVAELAFGGHPVLLAQASAKGLSLSLFVLLIIWAAVLLYNVVRLSGLPAIGATLASVTNDRTLQVLLVGWCFAGFMQGIAGFGVPVAVAAPLLVSMGVPAIVAAAAALIGHSWSVTFGSMGSSYYTIQLVTRIPGPEIGPTMALMFALPIFATGFAVAHLQGGLAGVRRSAPAIVLTGSVMAGALWLMNVLDVPQIASIVAGGLGCLTIALVSRSPRFRLLAKPALTPITGGADTASHTPPRQLMGFHWAFLPYYLLILLTLLAQVPAIKAAAGNLALGFGYPEVTSELGYRVAAETGYAKIRLVGHAAPLILLTTLLVIVVYRAAGFWRRGTLRAASAATVRQCVGTSLAIATMVMMALVMNDTGMARVLALGLRDVAGGLFPILSPYIGALGCFITGSNTNSNVMFGALQVEAARALGIDPVAIAAAQSIGGSLGSSIAPDKVILSLTIVGLTGREHELMRRTIPYCLVIVLLVGLQAWIVSY